MERSEKAHSPGAAVTGTQMKSVIWHSAEANILSRGGRAASDLSRSVPSL